jgi:hypothetical protein
MYRTIDKMPADAPKSPIEMAMQIHGPVFVNRVLEQAKTGARSISTQDIQSAEAQQAALLDVPTTEEIFLSKDPQAVAVEIQDARTLAEQGSDYGIKAMERALESVGHKMVAAQRNMVAVQLADLREVLEQAQRVQASQQFAGPNTGLSLADRLLSAGAPNFDPPIDQRREDILGLRDRLFPLRPEEERRQRLEGGGPFGIGAGRQIPSRESVLGGQR